MSEQGNRNGIASAGAVLGKIYGGVAVVLLGTLLLAWVTTAGDVRVNAGGIAVASERLDRYSAVAEKQAGETSEIKAELRAIKAILERMEKQLEVKRR